MSVVVLENIAISLLIEKSFSKSMLIFFVETQICLMLC